MKIGSYIMLGLLLFLSWNLCVFVSFTIPFDPFCKDYSVDSAIVMCVFCFWCSVDLPTLHFYRKLCHLHQWMLSIVYCYVFFLLLLKWRFFAKQREKCTITSKYMQLFFYYFQESVRSRSLSLNTWHNMDSLLLWFIYSFYWIFRNACILNELDGQGKRNKDEKKIKHIQSEWEGWRKKSLDTSSFQMCVFYCCSSIFIYILIYFITHTSTRIHATCSITTLSIDSFVFFILCEAKK